MDLHVIGPLASPAERAAVDAVLGPPESGWVGGPRDSAIDGHAARGGHATRARRSQLLPALHAVQSRIGWISQPALNYICKRLAVPPAEAYGVATFYALFATKPRPPVVAHVCDDIACRLAGAEGLCADLGRALGPAGEPARDGRATWLRSPCLGLCDRAPAALVTSPARAADAFTLAPVDAVGVAAALEADRARRATVGRDPRVRPPTGPSARLLGRVGSSTRPRSTTTARSGGYRALARALEIGPEAVIAEVTASKLMGRGGAAFPTGRKWAAVATQPAQPHYLVCNADESEPGHVQGSRAARGRPVRDRRGDDDRGLRDRRLEGLPLHPRRVPGGRGARHRRRSRRRARPACSVRTSSARASPSTSSSGAAPAPTSAARRRRSSSRSRASAASRATSRRSRSRSGCSASRPSSTTSRRWPTSRSSCSRAARRSPRSAPRARPARSSSACPATSRGRASTRSSSGRRCAT